MFFNYQFRARRVARYYQLVKMTTALAITAAISASFSLLQPSAIFLVFSPYSLHDNKSGNDDKYDEGLASLCRNAAVPEDAHAADDGLLN